MKLGKMPLPQLLPDFDALLVDTLDLMGEVNGIDERKRSLLRSAAIHQSASSEPCA